MSFDKLNSMLPRLFFFGAFVLLGLAVTQWFLELFGYTLMRHHGAIYYTAGRLLEFGTILMVFVIALLLRQMREELKKINGPS